MNLEEIWEFYRDDLQRVELTIQENLKSEVPLIFQVGNHLILNGGKRLRPLLVILSSRLCRYKGEADALLASIVEFIHTASLLHDDVVDGADLRRGRPVANSLWGNEASILVGDYLYSKALQLAVGLKNQRVMDTLSAATTTMCEGEVLQLLKISSPDITEREYLRMVRSKTAVLISSCCRLGGIISEVEGRGEEALASYGLNLGMAFQLSDDILDYKADESKLGKTLGKDIEEGKITLPLIDLLKRGRSEEIKRIKDIIKTDDFKKEYLEFILTLMDKYGSLTYCLEKVKDYLRKAKESLSFFQASPHRKALYAVADYVVVRER